jgi:cell wall-associated NlpC family hydrolase
MNPDELIAVARELVVACVPFRHQGRTLAGLDCIGCVLYVCTRVGVLPQDFERRNYGRLPQAELLQKAATYCSPLTRALPASLILIRWPGDSTPSHAALCTGPNLIHSYNAVGRVVEHGYRGHWVKRTASIWALPGVRYE